MIITTFYLNKIVQICYKIKILKTINLKIIANFSTHQFLQTKFKKFLNRIQVKIIILLFMIIFMILWYADIDEDLLLDDIVSIISRDAVMRSILAYSNVPLATAQ